MALTCTDVSRRFRSRGRDVRAVENVTLRVNDREFVCIVGPSGCGKTTLLKMVAGLLAPSSGEIRFDGDGGHTVGPRATLVFQEHGLYDWMRVVDNVAFGLETRGVRRHERRERAREFIARVGLEQFADAYPRELSVGMRQRVGIARAFLTGSRHLLMDEPFGSLDAQTKIILQQDLLTMWAREGTSILYVTHDIEEAVALGDRVIVMTGRPGRIREDIAVELPRPRGVGPERTADSLPIESHIWARLKEEVAWQLRAPA